MIGDSRLLTGFQEQPMREIKVHEIKGKCPVYTVGDKNGVCLEMATYGLTREEKEEIKGKLAHFLEKREEIILAYLHGSFLEGNFRDIDVAAYLTKISKGEALQYELNMENELKKLIGFSFDVRILNHAPLSFRFNVIKNGILLFSRDERLRCDFECLTIVEYHDFDFLRSTYRKEAVGIKI